MDPLSASFMDIDNKAYAAKGTGGANLAGGADYIGSAVPVLGLRNAANTADITSPITLPIMAAGQATTYTLLLKNNGGSNLNIASVVQSLGTPEITFSKDSGEAVLYPTATRQLDVYVTAAAAGHYSGQIDATSDTNGAVGTVSNIIFNTVFAPTFDYQYLANEYANADASLSEQVAAGDLISGQAGSIISGGLYTGVSVGGTEIFTNDDWDTNPLSALLRDFASPAPAIEIEYTWNGAHKRIDKVVIFSGHSGDGSRAFILADVSVDLGAGYAPLATLKTGAFGMLPSANAVGMVRIGDPAGLIDGVTKIKFALYDVSHNSGTYYFQDPTDNITNPPANYSTQGPLIKEIDVIGGITTSVEDWSLLK
jgi:hypothetical protein